MTIHKRILNVMQDVGAIKKDKQNKFQNYNFRGVDDVYNALHPALVKHGVFVVPEVMSVNQQERTSKKGELLIYTNLMAKFTFLAEDGTSISAVTAGEAMDSSDKSTNKAMSAAFKYALFQTLCIPTEETAVDSERDSHTVTPMSAMTEEQKNEMTAICEVAQIDKKEFCKKWGVTGKTTAEEAANVILRATRFYSEQAA